MMKGILKRYWSLDNIEETSIADSLFPKRLKNLYYDEISNEFEDPVETLYLDIAEKNKSIQEQESKINHLESLVEGLLKQVQRVKIEEKTIRGLTPLAISIGH